MSISNAFVPLNLRLNRQYEKSLFFGFVNTGKELDSSLDYGPKVIHAIVLCFSINVSNASNHGFSNMSDIKRARGTPWVAEPLVLITKGITNYSFCFLLRRFNCCQKWTLQIA